MPKCRICGSTRLERVLDLGQQPWGNDFRTTPNSCDKYPLELFFCHDCTLVQLGYTVPKEKMFINHSYMSGTTATLKSHFNALADSVVEKYLLGPDDLVVDIGGNDGTQLLAYKKHGCKTLNVESGTAQANASMDNDIPTANGFFCSSLAQIIKHDHGCAKIINAAGVFFHLEELHSVCVGIQSLLDQKGVFIVQFVYLGDIVQSNSFDNIYHEHLLYYTLKSLSTLLGQYNLTVFDVEKSPIHGGSVIAHVCHSGAYAQKESVWELEGQELALGLANIDTYRKFAKRVESVKNDIQTIFHNAEQLGETVYGYGAPVKGSTLINYCGLTSKQLPCCVEKNPLKCMKYYPGTDIPVIAEALAKKPDKYLVLAWNFLDEFVKKEHEFFRSGGSFIVPIPKPWVMREDGIL